MGDRSFPQPGGRDGASFRAETAGESALELTIEGRLDSATTGRIWRETTRTLEQASPARLVIDASKIEYCDLSGLGLLVELRFRQLRAGRDAEIRGLRAEFQRLLDLFPPALVEEVQLEKPKPANLAEEVGRQAVRLWGDIRTFVAFIGELCVAFVYAFRTPRRIRWKDALLVAETAGVNALPIVALISFLVGLIIAFQAAIPMRQFSAEIFVADLIGIAMVRELGPLMTAIVLAGRSGSAFAAELGTMKVNEEIDALTTMGLDPVRFLVVTRVIAALVMMPLLAVFADLLGVAGGSIVSLSLGYPLVTYVDRAIDVLNVIDLLGGLFKAVVFGVIVAGIGCLRGLQTGTGASAVGEAATRAVVTGIVLIVVTDGVLGIVFYYLGI